MTDTIIKGTGNSRTIKTVPNIKSMVSSLDDLLDLFIAGFPVDILGLNPTGVLTQGTDLTKGNLLTDATATGMGLTSAATPNDALAKLRVLIQNTDNKTHSMISGSYTGDGSSTKIVTFGFRPIFVFIRLVDTATIGNYTYSAVAFGTGSHLVSIMNTTNSRYASVKDEGVGSIENTGIKITTSPPYMNISGATYDYFSIG